MNTLLDPSRYSVSSLSGRWLRIPLRLIPRRVVVRIQSGELRGVRWIIGAMNHGCWLGTYERVNQRLLRRLLPPAGRFLDLGANVGFFSLLGSQTVGSQGHVVAVEPDPRNLVYLRRHLQLNGVRNVRVVGAAVAEVNGLVGFESGTTPSSGHIGEPSAYCVPAFSLDTLSGLVMSRPDVVKIDIEGEEAAALRGAPRLLEAARSIFLLSTHGDDAHTACKNILAAAGYRRYDLPSNLTHETLGTLRDALWYPQEREAVVGAILSDLFSGP